MSLPIQGNSWLTGPSPAMTQQGHDRREMKPDPGAIRSSCHVLHHNNYASEAAT
jgi:hypothetical protein